MSDTCTDPSDRNVDRPREVTDPLLWNLALTVADTHEPDGEGGCRTLLCAGQSWPCAAWDSAQRALRAARVAAEPAAPGVTGGQAGEPTGWSAIPTSATRVPPVAVEQTRRASAGAAAPAA